MLAKVELVNGQKVLTPISGTIPVDTVQSGNQYPVSSDAVYTAIDTAIDTAITQVLNTYY